jgi:PhnB protein
MWKTPTRPINALEAGALTIEKPVDMPDGDRWATAQDPWGNIWQIATHGGGAFA